MNILKYLKLRYQILVFPIIFMITLGVVYKFVHSSNALIGKELKTVRYNYIPYNDFTNRMLGTQASIKKSFQDAVAAQDSSKLETSSILATEFKALVDSAKSVHLGNDHALLDSTLESFDVYFSAANRASQLMLQEKYNTEMSENAKIMVAELKTLERLLAQVTAQEVDEAFENADYQLELLGANIRRVLFISLFIFLGLSFLISFSLTTAIKKTVYYIKELSEGNLSIIIPKGYLNRRDEIGDILKAVHALNTKLKEVILGVQQESSQILEISQQLEMTSNHLANGSNEQAEFVDKISSTMEQVSSKITLNAQNANETSVISNEANLKLKEVGEKSKEAISANERITNRISQINDIAFQTNLLALNAAIEAARAGEAGKGFAVVASEVQTLAKKSGTVADEINNLTKTAYNLSSEAGEVMFDIIPEIERTSILVGEIAFSSEEQSSGASEVNESIQKLNELSQTSAASSEELAATAENLLLQSKRLQESISFYRMEATKKAPNLPSPTHSKASTLSDFDLEMDEEDVVFAF